MRRGILPTALLIAALILNACSSPKNEAESKPPVQCTADTAAEIKEGYSIIMLISQS